MLFKPHSDPTTHILQQKWRLLRLSKLVKPPYLTMFIIQFRCIPQQAVEGGVLNIVSSECLKCTKWFLLSSFFIHWFPDRELHHKNHIVTGETSSDQGGEGSLFPSVWGWVVLLQDAGDNSRGTSPPFPLSQMDCQGTAGGAQRRARSAKINSL